MGVEIRNYNIIYQLIDDIELALHGMLEPVFAEVIVGRAEIRELFGGKRGAQIAGCRVTEGRMVRNGAVRVTRAGESVAQTTISSLRHFRDEVNEMNSGTECGIVSPGFQRISDRRHPGSLPTGARKAVASPYSDCSRTSRILISGVCYAPSH